MHTILRFIPLLLCSAALFANTRGADTRLTGAPGDDAQACTACHRGTTLNAGGGNLKINLPGAATYTPGVKQRISIAIADPTARRWGFELSARVASNPSSGQAGTLANADANAQITCDNGSRSPCADGVIQFATHTLAGTRQGTADGVTFEVDWTPPSTDAGPVLLYAAGNASNADNRDTGDKIYTASIELVPASSAPKPSISSERGVVNAASLTAAAAPNTWIAIAGTNLANSTRTWSMDEIAAGALPTSLDGVSVKVNGKAAYVESISPTKIIALTPADDALGTVEVKVSNNGVESDPVFVNLLASAPALFTVEGKYLAAWREGDAAIDRPDLLPSTTPAVLEAKPGDTILLFGTGFGPTDPAVAPGSMMTEAASLAAPVTVTIGGAPAEVMFAGLAAGLPDVYIVRLKIPDSVGVGDQPVTMTVGEAAISNAAEASLLKIAQ